MLRRIMNRVKELNEALPVVLLLDFVYLLIGEGIILIFTSHKSIYAAGFLAGVLYSVFSSFHMSFRIRKIVFGHADTSKTLLVGYFIRLAVMLGLFAVLYIFHIGDLLCAVIGMFSMKVSAYLQPFTDNFLTKIQKKGR